MLKRIFIIALFTGAGQLFIIFALKYISNHSSDEQLKAIAQIDSLVLFLINAIALGLQPATMRTLALQAEWKEDFKATQSARFTLGLLLSVFILLAFFNIYYLAFLLAPLLALSGDYALYGRGKPVTGSIISFIRSVIPFSLIVMFVLYQPELIAWIYLGGLLFTYYFTNILISFYLKAPLLSYPRLKNLRLYLKTIPLGLVSLGLYFIGMGVILVAPYLFSDAIVAVAYIGIKFFVIFKSVLRIIQQAFLKEMISDEMCLKVDQMSFLLGLTFAIFTICFPNTFIQIFFGEKFLPDKNYFMILSIAALIYSLFSSFTTRAMLEKKDKFYSIITLSAALLTLILCILLSFEFQNVLSIGISILTGEFIFAIGMLILMNKWKYFQERAGFLLRNISLLVIPIAAVILFHDSLIPFIVALIIYSLVMIVLYINKFDLPDNLKLS